MQNIFQPFPTIGSKSINVAARLKLAAGSADFIPLMIFDIDFRIIKQTLRQKLRTLDSSNFDNEWTRWKFCKTFVYMNNQSINHVQYKSIRNSLFAIKSNSSPGKLRISAYLKYLLGGCCAGWCQLGLSAALGEPYMSPGSELGLQRPEAAGAHSTQARA